MKIKVLYLEDEHFLGRIVSESLQAREFDVRLVKDGAKYMGAFESYDPDICVLDVMVPNIDGYTLASLIKERAPKIPIIFLTAKVQIEDILQGFKVGGNDYIKKPFSMEELIVRIHNLLALTTTEETPTQVHRIGLFTFYPTRFEIVNGDLKHTLSYKENELFKILAENINQNINRKDILEQLWGNDSVYNSRTLDVYIAKVRKMLSADKKIQLKTLRGIGYHFMVD